jgi:NADH-quinone oxidoreductase subunit M
MSILLILFLVPVVLSSAFFLTPEGKYLKRLAVIASLIPIVILGTGPSAWLGQEIRYSWMPSLSIQFFLSVDSLSLIFLYLTAVIIPVALFAADQKSGFFYGLVFLLQGLLIGFFTSRDLVLFTIFWEAMLIPLYFIISMYGGADRKNAALKFIIYMVAGSSLMVAGVLALYLQAHTFDLTALAAFARGVPYAKAVFFVFLLAFAVKTPLFPFHGWLPDAYCEAPFSGTILLSAILSKAGIYGIIRIGMELFPDLMVAWGPLLFALALTGVFYGGLAAWAEEDYKRVLAYSSLSHVNFVLAGLFVWNETAHAGAILQAVNHGIATAALFLVAYFLFGRLGTTSMRTLSGLAKYLPKLCYVTLFFVLANVALPGTSNFIGELLVFYGVFVHNPYLAAILGLCVILVVIYMLRFMRRIYFEAPMPLPHPIRDLRKREMAMALPLIFLILWIGIYPAPLLNQVQSAAKIEVRK